MCDLSGVCGSTISAAYGRIVDQIQNVTELGQTNLK